jgi:hypothetical protein
MFKTQFADSLRDQNSITDILVLLSHMFYKISFFFKYFGPNSLSLLIKT